MTLNASGPPASSTRIETLVSSSLSRRSRRLRDVTYCPSRPANGDVLIVKIIAIVGSSIWMCGSGFGFSGSVIVSPILMPSTPAMARMSPGMPIVSSTRFRPSNEYSFVICVFCSEPSSFTMPTSSPMTERAVEHAPDREPAEIVAVIEIGHQQSAAYLPDRPAAPGMCLTIASNSGRKICPNPLRA